MSAVRVFYECQVDKKKRVKLIEDKFSLWMNLKIDNFDGRFLFPMNVGDL